MRFKVAGAWRETGEAVVAVIDASTEADARRECNTLGIVVQRLEESPRHPKASMTLTGLGGIRLLLALLTAAVVIQAAAVTFDALGTWQARKVEAARRRAVEEQSARDAYETAKQQEYELKRRGYELTLQIADSAIKYGYWAQAIIELSRDVSLYTEDAQMRRALWDRLARAWGSYAESNLPDGTTKWRALDMSLRLDLLCLAEVRASYSSTDTTALNQADDTRGRINRFLFYIEQSQEAADWVNANGIRNVSDLKSLSDRLGKQREDAEAETAAQLQNEIDSLLNQPPAVSQMLP